MSDLMLKGSLAEIAEIIGTNPALALRDEFIEEKKIFFPKTKRGKYYDRIRLAIGGHLADRLCDLYASEQIVISTQAHLAKAERDEEIKQFLNAGYGLTSIAAHFGISPTHVSRIARRLSRASGARYQQLLLKVLPDA